jgi:hypothetical protein
MVTQAQLTTALVVIGQLQTELNQLNDLVQKANALQLDGVDLTPIQSQLLAQYSTLKSQLSTTFSQLP